MSFVESGADDQSEDGELRHSPTDAKLRQEELLDFSLSEEDVDTADSLDIKPPQINKLARNSSRSKRRDRRENRTRHSRSERHREERTHLHREKHHRERGRTRPEYHREYKELYRYTEAHSSTTNPIVGKYVDVQFAQNVRYERKYDETKKHERYEKDMRYQQEPEKSRRFDDKHMRLKSVADQTLDDLRERLLDKKRLKDATEEYTKHHSEKESRRRLKIQEQLLETALEQDADMYVKEIIDLSEERKDKNKSDKDDDKKILDSGSEEHELRKEKLLQAEREMSRQKEQYKLDRERRHQRRQERQEAKRKMQEEQLKEEKRKRQRISGELSVVTVSDASSRSSKTSLESRGSSSDRSSTSEEEMEDRSDVETTSGDEKVNLEERKVDSEETDEELRKEEEEEDYKASPESLQLAKSDRSSSRSRFSSDFPQISSIFSRFRSKSLSPKSNGQINKIPEEKPKSPSPKKLDEDLPPYFPAIQGCRSVEEFQCLNRIEEGTYGVVYRARDKRTEEIVALKRLKMEKEKEGFPITSLREINTLLKGQHPNIVTVREIVVGSNMDKIFIVMDYVEHDLKSLMETMRSRRQVFVPAEVKCLLKQLLGAVGHLHDNWILHRDLKTSNLLLSHKGILKVGDFGLAREYGSPLKPYTPVVVTLWYRAPELLLCAKEYSTPVDLWSVGCIFAELLLMNAYFPGKSEVDQLNRIFKELGTPNDRVWPSWPSLPAVKKMKFTDFPASNLSTRFSMLSEAGLSLLKGLLAYDPTRRLTADSALRVPWFVEAPLPIEPALFPTWPARSEMGPRRALHSPKPPSGGRDYKQLGDNDEDSALGFHMGGIQSSALEARRLAMGAGFSLKF